MAYSGPYPFPVAAGGTGQTTIPLFLATNSTGRTNVTGDGTAYTVAFDTVIQNITSSYNAGTFTFTAPKTGVYLFTTFVSFAGITSSHTAGIMYFATSTALGSIQVERNNPFANVDSGVNVYSATQIISLAATNTVSVTLTISNGAKVIAVQGGSFETTFGGYLLI